MNGCDAEGKTHHGEYESGVRFHSFTLVTETTITFWFLVWFPVQVGEFIKLADISTENDYAGGRPC